MKKKRQVKSMPVSFYDDTLSSSNIERHSIGSGLGLDLDLAPQTGYVPKREYARQDDQAAEDPRCRVRTVLVLYDPAHRRRPEQHKRKLTRHNQPHDLCQNEIELIGIW